MKYINTSNLKKATEEISYEVFNLIVGSKYFDDNGNVILEKSSSKYPKFKTESGYIYINTSDIFIFTEYDLIDGIYSFLEQNIDKLFNMEIPKKIYNALEINNRFSILKIVSNLKNVKPVILLCNRRCKIPKNNNIRSVYISDIKNFVYNRKNINKFISFQLCGIMYDPNKLYNLTNYEIINEIGPHNYTSFNKSNLLSSIGNLTTNITINLFMNEINKYLKQFKISIKYAYINKFNYSVSQKFILYFYFIYDRYVHGGFEIIKQLGNINIFGFDFCSYYRNTDWYEPLGQPNLYEIAFKDIIIDNNPKQNDICKQCNTPLYDDIYIIFNSRSSNIGKAYCPICIHKRFHKISNSNEKGFDTYFSNESNVVDILSIGEFLYKSDDIMGRTVYPRKKEEVIDMINIKEIRDLIKMSYSAYFSDIDRSDIIIGNYIGISYTDTFINNINFKERNTNERIPFVYNDLHNRNFYINK